jgi:hypothetical protein
VEERALAAAARADQGDELAGAGDEVDLLERQQALLAPDVGLPQAAYLDLRRRPGARRSP